MADMNGGAVSGGLTEAANGLSFYLGDVSAGVLSSLSDGDLLAELRECEALRRRWLMVDAALVAELERRSFAGRLAMPSTSTLLQGVLRLSPTEARQRVDAAAVCGPRWSLTGERLEPLLPRVAASQADGVLSAEHARVIASTIERLPASVAPADAIAAEEHLVRAAGQLRPREVGLVGQRILAHLDPDGVLQSDAEHARRRSFSVTPESGGGYRASGRLTPACGALLLTWLSPRAAPRPATSEVPHNSGDNAAEDNRSATGAPSKRVQDARSYGQRMHDALEELAGLAVRRTEVVESGAPAQVIITMTASQLADRSGLAETSFGQLLTVPEALRLADEAAISLLVRDARGAILKHGRLKRIATRAQTLALIARDRGCSFPGCDRPPEWCQRHHVVGWAEGGRTDLDNLTLICGYHHRHFEAEGWSCRLVEGLPTWIPPHWIDRERRPRRNHRITHELR
jgi:hypothetical protein